MEMFKVQVSIIIVYCIITKVLVVKYIYISIFFNHVIKNYWKYLIFFFLLKQLVDAIV